MTELNVVFFSGIHVLCLVCTFIQSNPAFLRVTELNVVFSLVLAFCVSCVHLYRVTRPFCG